MFRSIKEEDEPCRLNVLLSVCRTSLEVLVKSNPRLPDYSVPMMRLVNSSRDYETREVGETLRFGAEIRKTLSK